MRPLLSQTPFPPRLPLPAWLRGRVRAHRPGSPRAWGGRRLARAPAAAGPAAGARAAGCCSVLVRREAFPAGLPALPFQAPSRVLAETVLGALRF